MARSARLLLSKNIEYTSEEHKSDIGKTGRRTR